MSGYEIMTVNERQQWQAGEVRDFSAENEAVIEHRWPDVLRYLAASNTPVVTEYITNKNETTLCVNGIHLSSCYDRNEEIKLQAGLVANAAETVWVYGVGVGDLPRYLLENKRFVQINVVVMSSSVFKSSMHYFDHREWLSDPRINLYLPEQLDAFQVPFCTVPACLKLVDAIAVKLRDEVVLEINTPFIHKKYQENKSHVINLEDNIELVRNDKDAIALFEGFSDKTKEKVYITAAGPSLADNLNVIKERDEDTLLITVDAALPVLRRSSIVPDVVVSIDSAKDSIGRYLDLEGNLSDGGSDSADSEQCRDVSGYTNVPLVYFPVVNNQVLLSWPGPRYVAYSRNTIYDELMALYPRAQLYSAGSVIHPAVDLAVKMGGKCIHLFGVDLSFPGGVSHTEGVPGSKPTYQVGMQREVMNGEGNMVPSWPNMIGYLRDLERYIANNNSIRFINMSRKGAVISGTRYSDE